jgi:hypothetical protein
MPMSPPVTLISNRIRYRVDPRDVPLEKAARRLHLTPAEFDARLPELLKRGFPPADSTTAMFDLDAINAWMSGRHPKLFGLIAPDPLASDNRVIDMGDRFRATQERRRLDSAA